MRQSVAAIALIRWVHKGQPFWLTQWNMKWQQYHFIAGHKLPHETFLQCIIREIAEELRLHEGTDFLISPEPLAHLEFEGWSESSQIFTAYTMELFNVQLSEDSSFERVRENARNRWLTEAEIQAERCQDDRPVSATMRLILSKAGLWTVET